VTHNGIEYALLQAYGEGFEILNKGHYKLDFEQISKIWSNGSIIRSYLSELAIKAFKKDPHLKKLEGIVGGGETGKWTINTAKKLGANAKLLETALDLRIKTRKHPTFAGKVVAALRNEFGGHAIVKKKH